jgi:feruloyl-CoA synthase
VPGVELKLVPTAGKLEARLRGPSITPGYWRQPALTATAFDEEGFYRIGDALRFADEAAPERGLVFDGRVAEDFKLNSGTWVHVGALRLRLVEAGNGLIQDAAITGHDRDQVGALLFLNPAAAGALSPPALRQALQAVLRGLAEERGGSSLSARRALVMPSPPSPDAGEINDKGYLNQRTVLQRRDGEVARLYQAPLDPAVITADGSQHPLPPTKKETRCP